MNEGESYFTPLDPAQSALLSVIQDELVPREGDLPGAGEVGGAASVDGYLSDRPDLQENLLLILVRVATIAELSSPARSQSDSTVSGFASLSSEQRCDILRAIEVEQTEAFRSVVELTYSAYYTNPRIQTLLGPDSQPPQPKGYPAPPPFDERRLKAVKKRGQPWRDA